MTDHGKAGVFDGVELRPEVRKLVEAGYEVLSADLLGQGEFSSDGQSVAEQPMWYQRGGTNGWQQFSGYTFGYNHSLFAKRVHDVLTVVRHAADQQRPVHMVGIGNQAGPIAVAACSQMGGAVEQTFVDFDGFRFESLTGQSDPMFVPGAVKYLDVDGLIALCPPGNVHVVAPPSRLVQQITTARGDRDAVVWHDSTDALKAAVMGELVR